MRPSVCWCCVVVFPFEDSWLICSCCSLVIVHRGWRYFPGQFTRDESLSLLLLCSDPSFSIRIFCNLLRFSQRMMILSVPKRLTASLCVNSDLVHKRNHEELVLFLFIYLFIYLLSFLGSLPVVLRICSWICTLGSLPALGNTGSARDWTQVYCIQANVIPAVLQLWLLIAFMA